LDLRKDKDVEGAEAVDEDRDQGILVTPVTSGESLDIGPETVTQPRGIQFNSILFI